MISLRSKKRNNYLLCGCVLMFCGSAYAQSTNPDSYMHLGGAVRMNYGWMDYARNSALAPELVRANFDGAQGPYEYAFDYRWLPNDVHYPLAAWGGWRSEDRNTTVRAGIITMPFGLFPEPYQNFWGSVDYLAGFTNNPNLGVLWNRQSGNDVFYAGYFASDEYGNGKNTSRNAGDLIITPDAPYKQGQMALARYEHTFDALNGKLALGMSGLGGQAKDVLNHTNYNEYAVAAHAQLDYTNTRLQFQWIHYNYNVPNDYVRLGVVGMVYPIARQADVPSLNAAYKWLHVGPLDYLQCYNNLSGAIPYGNISQSHRSVLNVVGCLLSKNHMMTYIDLISAKNVVTAGGNDVALTSESPGWHTRLNVNIGFYF